jgi:hypothetical protein
MQTCRMDQMCQLSDGLNLKLGHDARAVPLDRALVDAHIASDLLVEAPAQDMREHLAVARSEGFERRS